MKLIADIETLKGLFTISFIDWDTGQQYQFIISDKINQLNEIRQILNKTKYLIGFNSIAFDSVVLNWMIKQGTCTAAAAYNVAQTIISTQDQEHGRHPYYSYTYNTPWQNIDLFLYWSKMIRMSKKLSLKFFAVNLDMKIQEMPIHHSQEDFSDEEIIQVLDYNMNDVLVTRALLDRIKDQVNLRLSIKREYGLNALSWDAPKIGSELMLDSFCRKTYEANTEGIDISFADYKKEVRNSRLSSFTYKNGDYLPPIEFKTDIFKDLYREVANCNNGFSKELLFRRYDRTYLKITYGSGGIHSVNKNECYFSTDWTDVYTSDVASLYPTLLENYKFMREQIYEVLEVYSETKQRRFKAKKEGNKTVDKTMKLILNAATGLLDNEHSWLYSPPQIMALRLTGQLILTRLLEECDINKFTVISLNTDGIELVVPKEREAEYLKVIENIEKEFNLIFEHDKYRSIHYKSVNDYIAISQKGKVKTKGEFIYEKVPADTDIMIGLVGACEFLVIPLAVKEYFVNKTPIEQTIKSHNNIYDFCCSKKLSSDYSVWYLGEKQQRLNRFFCSTKGAYLYKKKVGKSSMEHIFKDSGVHILNDTTNLSPSELSVDFNYYISRAKEVISLFEKQQLTLF